jgi:stage V sporulation protein D (sporulation-specific penicillin-binding protein)
MESAKRIRLLFSLFLLLILMIVARLFFLQIVQHAFFQARSLDQRKRIINLSANRGDIFDRNGEILATSIDTYSVFTQAHGFAWLARKLPPAGAQKLKAQDPKNYIVLKEKKRLYPNGKTAAQTIGFAGSDNQGLSGVELALDKYLKGKAGQVVTEGDPGGRELYGAVREIDPSEDGMDVTLTIDKNIQYVAEREIEEQIRQSQAISGMLIVMNAKNGEILALASKPDFDPNDYKKAAPSLWHSRCLDPYEPGSTFKLITTAAGLEENVIALDSKLKALDQLEIGGRVIENSHKIDWPGPSISLSMMLEQSINTGAAQVGLKLGPQRFYESIKKFGFGERTGFGLDGESSGIVRHWQRWYKPDIAMITFGQSIAVTPLQLMSAVSAFANHGNMAAPTLIKKIESRDGKFVKVFGGETRGQAVSDKTAAEMKTLMRNVVLYGSGRRAQMKWFDVGGKTGTAQKSVPGGRGYMKGHYIASFIGLAPLKDPEIVVLVIVDDPKGSIWGESVCGPVFKRVVEYSLRYLNVKPDTDIMTNVQ